MIEIGKCYYNKRVIVKILEIMDDRYYVNGFDVFSCTYYQCAIMSKNNQLIEFDNKIYDKILNEFNLSKLQGYNSNLSIKVRDLINEEIYGI